MTPISRGSFATEMTSLGCVTATQSFAAHRRQRRFNDPFSGVSLYSDVVHYSGLGEHRTGFAADRASTDWLGSRLRQSGYLVETPGFDLATFDPQACQFLYGDVTLEGFPAWPVVATSGTTGVLQLNDVAGDLSSKVALVILSYRPGAAFVARGYGSAVLEAQSRGAAAIVVVTEGPTGEIVALNAHLERYAWRVPVILVAGKVAARLKDLAASASRVTVKTLVQLFPECGRQTS